MRREKRILHRRWRLWRTRTARRNRGLLCRSAEVEVLEPRIAPAVLSPEAALATELTTASATGEIRGTQWHDLDGDGTREDGEPGLPGWTLFLDTNGNGQLDTDEPTATTDADGRYAFTGLAPGEYLVAEVAPSGWAQTHPGVARLSAGALGPADWLPVGPTGGNVHAVDISPVDPNLALAAIDGDVTFGGGLYRSTDGGTTWSWIRDLGRVDVHDLEFTPEGVAYAGTLGGLWRSADGGATWTKLDLGIGVQEDVVEVSIDPGDSNHIWIGISGSLGTQTINVMRSTDAGATWNDVTPPLDSAMAGRGITFDPNNPGHVFVAFGGSFSGGALWFTPDNGATWFDRSAGLPGDSKLNDVVHDGSRVLVTGGAAFGPQNVGLYESLDDGATWSPLHDASWPLLRASDIEIDPHDPSTILLASLGEGLFRSTDGGATWSFGVGGTDSMSLNSVRFRPGSSSQILLGATSFGVLQSTDGGMNFDPSSDGIFELNTSAVAINPGNESEMAVAFQALNSGGVYTSIDGGLTWQLEPVPATRWNAVEFAPDGTLYGTTGEALYRRETDGSWTRINPDVYPDRTEAELLTIRFSSHDPNLIFVGGSDNGPEGYEAALWRSTDGGGSWSKVYEGTEPFEDIRDIEIIEDGTDSIVLASFSDHTNSNEVKGGVVRSADGGVTWTISGAGLPDSVQGYDLALSPADPNTVLLADAALGSVHVGGVYRSSDAGQNWTSAGEAGSTRELLIDPDDAQIVYSVGFSSALRSEDGGATFDGFNQGLEDIPADSQGSPGFDFAYIDGRVPRLYLATPGGIYATNLYSTERSARTVVLADGEVTTGVDFGNKALPGQIRGTVWYDADRDGVRDEAVGLDQWTVFIDEDGDSALDPEEPFRRTNDSGSYRFTQLPAGQYIIAQIPQPGWEQTYPEAPGTHAIDLGQGEEVSDADFGNWPIPAEVHGVKWHDMDGDGVRDADEPPLEGWTIYLDDNYNGQHDSGELSTTTDAQGRYSFDNLRPGVHVVAEVPQAGWRQTLPGSGTSDGSGGSTSGSTAGSHAGHHEEEGHAGEPVVIAPGEIRTVIGEHHVDPGHPESPHTHFFAETGDEHHFAWQDRDTSTPEIVDIWYDFRDHGGFANQITTEQQAAAEAALQAWADATLGKANFIRNTTAAGADIINIGTGDLAALGETSQPGGVLGLGGGTFTHNTDHTITGGIAWMDVAETWDTTIGNGDPAGTFDYFTVAAQEIGHALGLGHTDDLPGPNIMNGFYEAERTESTIFDESHIRSVYGVASDEALGFYAVAVDWADVVDGADFGSEQVPIPFEDLFLDFGTSTSPVAAGYTRITAGDTYDTARGHGWTLGSIRDVDRGDAAGSDLERDFSEMGFGEFVVDVPNGTYTLTVTLGDAAEHHDKFSILAEGTEVVRVNNLKAGRFLTETFDVDVVDRQLTLQIDDHGGRNFTAVLNGLEIVRQAPPLGLTITPNSIAENDGAGAATGTVTRDGDTSQDLLVGLASSDTSEAVAPASVTIPAGASSADFAIDAVDDDLSDGAQNVILSASADGFQTAQAALEVTDDEGPPPFAGLSLDFGHKKSPVADGYEPVYHNTHYDAALGYGWLTGKARSRDTSVGDSLRRDFNATDGATFGIDMPADTYTITLILGDHDDAHDQMAVSLEGTQVDTISTAAGEFITRSYEVTVNDARLILGLEDLGGSDRHAVINAMDVAVASTSGSAATVSRVMAVSDGSSGDSAVGLRLRSRNHEVVLTDAFAAALGEIGSTAHRRLEFSTLFKTPERNTQAMWPIVSDGSPRHHAPQVDQRLEDPQEDFFSGSSVNEQLSDAPTPRLSPESHRPVADQGPTLLDDAFTPSLLEPLLGFAP